VRFYLDSAYVAKCYLQEPDAEAVRGHFLGKHELHSSAWCLIEMACLFHRNVREKHLTREQAGRLQAMFREDLEDGVWLLVPLSEALLRRAEAAVQALRADILLRAGDAIHLVSAREAGFTEVWSNDKRLLEAAGCFGLRGRTV
jgi:predicted nucleic acid-binding protein